MILRSHNHPAYRQRLTERFGFLPSYFKSGGIVVHAASVGEVIALKPFIEALLKKHHHLAITITSFTPTGSEQVTKMFGDQVQHCYLPLDIFPCTGLFLTALKPKILVLMETELWPNLIAQCHKKKVKLQLINGRLSDNSMKSYSKLKWLIQPCLRRFDTILAQSHDNQANFISLGAKPESCIVSGNLKFDLQLNANIEQQQQTLKKLITHDRQVWLVASTHPGDEEIILSAFETLKNQYENLLLILVPRHPERFDNIFQLCQQHGFSTVRRSEKIAVTLNNDIWLIDTLGELLATCGLADIVTMGGSFSAIGGHNPLEPALFKKPIVVGHDMSNFRKVMEQLTTKQGIEQLTSDSSTPTTELSRLLTDKVHQLLADDDKRLLLGNNAYLVVNENQGATARSITALNVLLTQ